MNKKVNKSLLAFLSAFVLLAALTVCDIGGGGGGGGGGGKSGSLSIKLPGSGSSKSVYAENVSYSWGDPSILKELVFNIKLTKGTETKTYTGRGGQTVNTSVSEGRWRINVEAMRNNSRFILPFSFFAY